MESGQYGICTQWLADLACDPWVSERAQPPIDILPINDDRIESYAPNRRQTMGASFVSSSMESCEFQDLGTSIIMKDINKFWRAQMRLDDQNSVEGKIAAGMTATEAKMEVNAQLERIDKLSRQHFRYDENLAHEGFIFVLDKLEADNWKRIREWNQKGRFTSYITVVTSNLLKDFRRKKDGYRRMPTWLRARDQIWHDAYHWSIEKKWARREVIEQLQTLYRDRQRWYLDEMVATIISKCQKPPIELELQPDPLPAPGSEMTRLELGEALRSVLEGEVTLDSAVPPQIVAMVDELKGSLSLSTEDRLILRLRFLEGASVPTIKKMLHLNGDIYKRINKLLEKIREACHLAGLEL